MRCWCLTQKGTKQCCEAPKLDCTHCAGQRGANKLCGISAMFGIILEKIKHLHLMRSRLLLYGSLKLNSVNLSSLLNQQMTSKDY